MIRHVAAGVLLLAAACGSPRDSTTQRDTPAPARYKALRVGDSTPKYVTATLAGDTVRLGEPNQPLTVMNVWATWCTSCREEMADLQRLHEEYQGRGVRVLGVSVDEADERRVRRFVEHEKLSFPMAHDQEGRVQQLYQVSGIPNTFIIGTNGRILWKSIGNLHGIVDSLRRVLDSAGAH